MISLKSSVILLALALASHVDGTPVPVGRLVVNAVTNVAKQAGQSTLRQAGRTVVPNLRSAAPSVVPKPQYAPTSQVLKEIGVNGVQRLAAGLGVGYGAAVLQNHLEAGGDAKERRSLEKRVLTPIVRTAARTALRAKLPTPSVARMALPKAPQVPSNTAASSFKDKALSGITTAFGGGVATVAACAIGEGVGGTHANVAIANLKEAADAKAALGENKRRSIPFGRRGGLEESSSPLSRRAPIGGAVSAAVRTSVRAGTAALRQGVREQASSTLPRLTRPIPQVTPQLSSAPAKLPLSPTAKAIKAVTGFVAAGTGAYVENGSQGLRGDLSDEEMSHLMTTQGVKEAFQGAKAVTGAKKESN